MKLQRQLKKLLRQLALRGKVHTLKIRGEMVKVVIGAGSTRYNGWLMTDLPVLDALISSDWYRIFPQSSIHRILAEHVVEHWTESQLCAFLRIVRPFLLTQGFIRIAVPDGCHPDPHYVNYVRPGGDGAGAEDHKVLYTYSSLAQILSKAQYDYRFLEYFDEAGRFQQSAWKTSDGFICRSAQFDERNKLRPLSYTSLIVDAWVKE